MPILTGYYKGGDKRRFLNKDNPAMYNMIQQINSEERIPGTFRVIDFCRGRSSIQFTVENTATKEQFHIFLKDLFDFVLKDVEFQATLRPVKKGSNLAWKPE